MYTVGRCYNRQLDIHDQIGGQRYGGIATPSQHPYVVAFTSPAGTSYGYADRFNEEGIFLYTGEGRVGHMEMTKGNRAILNHRENKRSLLVFESFRREGGIYRFMGEADCIGYHIEPRIDQQGQFRDAIIFHLVFKPSAHHPVDITAELPGAVSNRMSLNELRKLSRLNAPDNVTVEYIQKVAKLRSEAVRRFALKRSEGNCELCGERAPFRTKHGFYLEVHHIYRLADGGPDDPENVAAICPNCHRAIHLGINGQELNNKLILGVSALERLARI